MQEFTCCIASQCEMQGRIIMLDFFRTVNETLWGGSPFQYFFYLSIAAILLSEKRRSVRIILGWYPLVFYIAMFNPLTYRIMLPFFYWDQVPYYCRMFSMCPILYCIGYGLFALIRKTEGFMTLLVVTAACGAIAFTGRIVYREPWMQKAQNFEKVPADVLEITALIPEKEKPVCLAVPASLSAYIRQVDANILTPYGRVVDSFGGAIVSHEPNVKNIMVEAGRRSVDYITVRKLDTVKAAFDAEGYTPFGETDNYYVYAVSGVRKTKRTLNEKRQIALSATFDAEGNPEQNAQGYAAVAYEYDEHSFISRYTYYDAEGNRTALPSGISAVAQTHTFSGLLETETYLDIHDEPLAAGFVSRKLQYDRKKNKIRESYYDAEGNPMAHTDLLYASHSWTYDAEDRILSERFYGPDNRLILNKFGYAGIDYEYTEGGRVHSVTYVDEQEKPVISSDGYASVIQEYDEQGRVAVRKMFDNEGNPSALYGVLAELRYEYREDGDLSVIRCFDANGSELPMGSAYLHSYLQSLLNRDVTVFISIKDEGVSSLTSTLREDLHELGTQIDLKGKERNSYVAVISPQETIEEINEASPVNAKGTVQGIPYQIVSAGFTSGNSSSIMIGGAEYSKNSRGMNIAVFDNQTKTVIDSFAIDTYLKEMPVIR